MASSISYLYSQMLTITPISTFYAPDRNKILGLSNLIDIKEKGKLFFFFSAFT